MLKPRGWLMLSDGTLHSVPEPMLHLTEIRWRFTLWEPQVTEAAETFPLDDFYTRHEILRGKVLLYLKPPMRPEDVPAEVRSFSRGA